MTMYIDKTRYEFELVVKKYGRKYENQTHMDPYLYRNQEEEPKEELIDKLEFKSLSALEVLRKLLDYIASI